MLKFYVASFLFQVMNADEGYNFFMKVLPVMTKLCLDLPNLLTAPLPLLKRGLNHSISLTQKQIASLLANSFFSTFPYRLEHDCNYPSVNFIEYGPKPLLSFMLCTRGILI
jgi:poly(ADP-ribose) glycohydrolase